MNKGIVQFYGKQRGKSKIVVGIQFEKKLRKKVNSQPYFQGQIGYCDFVEGDKLRKIKKAFNLNSFKKFYEAKMGIKKNRSKSKRPTKQKSKELIKDKSVDKQKQKIQKQDTEEVKENIKEEIQEKQQKVKQEQKEVKQQQQIPETISKSEMKNDQLFQEYDKLKQSYQNLDEEKKEIYFKLQNIQMQNSEFIVQNTQKDTKIKQLQNECQVLMENYKNLKESQNNQDDENKDNVKLMEDLNQFKNSNKVKEEEILKLKEDLNKFKDYDEFKKKFEKISIDYESIQIEKDKYKKDFEIQKQMIQDLKDQIEIYELENDLVARGDEIPEDPEELKQNYIILKNAFDKVDIELEIQKETYQEKINDLNDKISQIQEKYQNSHTFEEENSLVKKKDEEIQNLYKLIDQYSKSNKMVETLTEQVQQKEDNILKNQEEMKQMMERLGGLEEEIQLLEEINNEYEQTYEVEQEKIKELEQTNEQLQELNAKQKQKLNSYQEKVEVLKDEKNELELDNSKIQDQTEQYSSFYQQYNKVLMDKQNKIKEKMTYKMHGQESYWQAMQWRMYFDSIPENLTDQLNMKYFDKLRQICLMNDKIDISVENICLNYLTDQTVKEDNINLFGTSKDLFTQLIEFQLNLNYLKNGLIYCENLEQIEKLEQSELYFEINKNYQLIEQIYDSLKSNDYSANFCFSSLMESNIKLKDTLEFDQVKNQNFKFKQQINDVLVKLVIQFNKPETLAKDQEIIKSLIPKILFMSEQAFEMKVDDQLQRRLESLNSEIEFKLVEFRLWIENLYKNADDLFLNAIEIKDSLKIGFWKINIDSLHEKLGKLKSMENTIENQVKSIEEKNDLLLSKSKEIDEIKKIKNEQENKMMRLQTKANKLTNLKMENDNLKSQHQKLQQKLKKVKEQRDSITETTLVQ